MKSLPLEGKKAHCVVKEVDQNLERASRNLSRWIEVKRASDLNAFHILQHEKIILEQDSVGVIEERLLGAEGAEASKARKVEDASAEAPAKKAKTAKAKVVKKTKAQKSAVLASKRTKAAVKAKSAANKAAKKGGAKASKKKS